MSPRAATFMHGVKRWREIGCPDGAFLDVLRSAAESLIGAGAAPLLARRYTDFWAGHPDLATMTDCVLPQPELLERAAQSAAVLRFAGARQ